MIDKIEEDEWREEDDLSLVHDAIGWASYKAGRVEEGRNELERALELWEENTSAHYHLGQVFRTHGDRGRGGAANARFQDSRFAD